MIKELVDKDDPILRTPCGEFDFENPPMDPSQLAVDLTETMLKNNGLGLAAPQIGLPHRCFVLLANPIIAVFNPILLDATTEETELDEGCLSYPGLLLKIKRPSAIKVRYAMPNGEVVTHKYVGMTARAFQHEMDHLDGIFFTDKVSRFRLALAKDKLKKKLKGV